MSILLPTQDFQNSARFELHTTGMWWFEKVGQGNDQLWLPDLDVQDI